MGHAGAAVRAGARGRVRRDPRRALVRRRRARRILEELDPGPAAARCDRRRRTRVLDHRLSAAGRRAARDRGRLCLLFADPRPAGSAGHAVPRDLPVPA